MGGPCPRRADRALGRAWAGEGSWRLHLTGRFVVSGRRLSCRTVFQTVLLRLLFDLQQGGGLDPESAQLGVVGLIAGHPLDGPVVPPAGLPLLALLPARHGQEEPVVTVGPAELRGLLQR